MWVMLVLIASIVFGVVIASFAIQNTAGVTINFGQYTFSKVPLYMVAIGSLLLGLVIAYLISLIDEFSHVLKIHGKENALKEAKKSVAELTKRVHQLELENVRLNPDNKNSDAEDRSL